MLTKTHNCVILYITQNCVNMNLGVLKWKRQIVLGSMFLRVNVEYLRKRFAKMQIGELLLNCMLDGYDIIFNGVKYIRQNKEDKKCK